MYEELYDNCQSVLYTILIDKNLYPKQEVKPTPKNIRLIIKYICKNLPRDMMSCSYDTKLYYISQFPTRTLLSYINKIKNISLLENFFLTNHIVNMKKLTTPRSSIVKKYNPVTQEKIDKCNEIIKLADELYVQHLHDKIYFYKMIRKNTWNQ